MGYFINQKGNKSALIGGVRQLKEFLPTEIELRVIGGTVKIIGERLTIEHFDENEIYVKGKIDSIITEK